MTEHTALSSRSLLGQMTATERAAGRFLRGPDEHPPAAVEPAAPAVPVTPPAAPETPPAAPARPEGLPDAYWDDAAGVKPEAYSRLAELEAAEADRRAGVPESPDKYEMKPTEAVLGADGAPVTIDASDPLAAAIMPVLHKHGVGQAVVSDLLSAFLAQEVEGAKAQGEYVKAEQEKLGAKHAERTAALHSSVTAAIGAEAADHLRRNMNDAAGVIALEQLVAKLNGPAISAAPKNPAPASLAERIYG